MTAFAITENDWNEMTTTLEQTSKSVDELCIIVKGRPNLKVPGLIDKVDDNHKEIAVLRKMLEDFLEERKRQKALTIGIAIGIGLNIVTGVATLSSVAQVLKAIATGVP